VDSPARMLPRRGAGRSQYSSARMTVRTRSVLAGIARVFRAEVRIIRAVRKPERLLPSARLVLAVRDNAQRPRRDIAGGLDKHLSAHGDSTQQLYQRHGESRCAEAVGDENTGKEFVEGDFEVL
jgi:hypothetical protein